MIREKMISGALCRWFYDLYELKPDIPETRRRKLLHSAFIPEPTSIAMAPPLTPQ